MRQWKKSRITPSGQGNQGSPVIWTIKKAESQRTDAFELWWRRLLRVPWPIGKPNRLILKEINPEYSLERVLLQLKLQ